MFAIINTETNIHIGNLTITSFNTNNNGSAFFGIMIGDKGFWNGGYGSEAVSLLTDYLFNDLKLERVYLKTLDWNIRAQKSFQKCGFVEYRRNSRGAWDFILMEILRADWEKQSDGNRVLKEYPKSVFPQS